MPSKDLTSSGVLAAAAWPVSAPKSPPVAFLLAHLSCDGGRWALYAFHSSSVQSLKWLIPRFHVIVGSALCASTLSSFCSKSAFRFCHSAEPFGVVAARP